MLPAWTTGLIVTLLGCQTYRAQPLDRAAHRSAWSGRDLAQISREVYRAREARGAEPQATEGAAAAASPFDATDGLDLEEGKLVALVFNPGLRLSRLAVSRRVAGAAEAGRMRDPVLTMNLLRVVESFPDPWVITPALTFSVPLSDRLDAERNLAGAQVTAAEWSVAELEWSTTYEVERAWIAWSAALYRVEQTQAFVAALDGLVDRAAQLVEVGELEPTEGGLFGLERARQRARLSGLEGAAEAAEQELRRLLGLAPTAPVALAPAIPQGREVSLGGARSEPGTNVEEVGAWIEEHHPRLGRLAADYAAAEETLRLEIEKQWPDMGLGPMFDSDAGQDRLGLTFTLPLPFLNANRRAIAEARVDRDIARATLETAYELLVGQWAAVRARLDSLALQRSGLEGELVPLIERQVSDAAELIGLGEASSLVLLESLTRAYETEMDVIRVRADEARSRAELHFVLGPAGAPTREREGSDDEGLD